jgi:hypothetical protein
MKKSLIALSMLLVLSFMLTACNAVLTTGTTETASINVPANDKNTTYDVRLEPGAATVNVSANGDGVLQGTVDYNIAQLKPNVYSSGSRVEISQSNVEGIVPRNAKNDWQLKLGEGVPMNLTVNTGASKGNWDLGGISLRSLNFSQGAADTQLNFGQVNPVSLDNFNVNSGAASLKINGMGNANIKNGTLKTGAGKLELSFDGKLAQNATINLEGGVSGITIYSGGNPVQVVREESGLSSIKQGSWSKFGNNYESPEWASAGGSKVTIYVKIGVGSLELK